MRAVATPIGVLALGLAAPAPAQSGNAGFDAAVARYSACMIATVRMGMTTRMDPAAF